MNAVLDRRTLMSSAVATVATPPLMVSAAAIAGMATSAIGPIAATDDPLLDAIKAYEDGIAAYEAVPEGENEEPDFLEATLGRPQTVLENWSERALTRESALAALTLAVKELGNNSTGEVAYMMTQAALEYFEAA